MEEGLGDVCPALRPSRTVLLISSWHPDLLRKGLKTPTAQSTLPGSIIFCGQFPPGFSISNTANMAVALGK